MAGITYTLRPGCRQSDQHYRDVAALAKEVDGQLTLAFGEVTLVASRCNWHSTHASALSGQLGIVTGLVGSRGGVYSRRKASVPVAAYW